MKENKTNKKNTAKKTTVKKTVVAKKTTAKSAPKKQDNTNINLLMKTNIGEIKLELYPDKAPVTVENFILYVKSNFFNGLIFHRVIDGFMIQGGGFDENMHQKETQAPIKIESDNGLKNTRGTIAMARTNDPNSATSQFFINLVNNPFLDFTGYGYTVFGKVTDGMDVVDKIATVPTGSFGYMQDVPKYLIQIENIEII